MASGRVSALVRLVGGRFLAHYYINKKKLNVSPTKADGSTADGDDCCDGDVSCSEEEDEGYSYADDERDLSRLTPTVAPAPRVTFAADVNHQKGRRLFGNRFGENLLSP